MFNAHFVPVSYLKAFADDPLKDRLGKVLAFGKNNTFTPSVDKICVCRDYYTNCPKTDFKLFESQETTLANLANTNDVPPSLSNHIWQLKLRNRAILDSTRYRQFIAYAAIKTDLGERHEIFITTSEAEEFITGDDPVIVYGGNNPQEFCFLLTISPNKLFVSAPKNLYRIVSSIATSSDIAHINKLVCRQVRLYAISRIRKINIDELRNEMPMQAHPAASDVVGQTIIINFVGPNPRGPDGLPSFLQLR